MNPSTIISVTKRFTFEASHILNDPSLSKEENQSIFGKCSRMHGHSYKLYVTVTADTLTNGMIINFRDLKRIVMESVIEKIDHRHINDMEGFDKNIPTAENIASSIWKILEEEFHKNNIECKIKRIRLYETETGFADILEKS